MNFRTGIGYDAHKLVDNIPLIIGGVTIPFHKGSEGHSDGDVLIHAIVDSILGALSLGDIGDHFSSNNPKWKNVKSKLFLKYSKNLMEDRKYYIENIDSTIILQDPVLKKYIFDMKQNITDSLDTNISNISIKATTTDKLGFIGKGKGIAAIATVLLKR